MRLRLLWILLVFPTLPAFAAETNLLHNGGFEGPFAANGVADGWVADSYSNWGDYDITYARETANPHAGQACQRINGRWRRGSMVSACEQKGRGPASPVGTEWTALRASGEVPFLPERPYAFIRLFADRPNTIWVDDVVLRQDEGAGRDERPRAAVLCDRHPGGAVHRRGAPAFASPQQRPAGGGCRADPVAC